MGRRTVLGVLITGGLVVGLASPVSAASAGYGYVLVTKHKAKIGRAYKAKLAKDSAGGAPTVVRTAKGAYTVRFPKLGRRGGVAHVTPYGGTLNSCSVVDWTPKSAGRLDVRVYCVNPGGGKADTRFSLAYTNITTRTGRYAYVVSDKPSAATFKPTSYRQFNSTGGTNTITRTATGRYTVSLPGLGSATSGGHPQVTAYGAVKARCNIMNWTTDADVKAQVSCKNLDGDFRDTRFALTFVANTGIQRRKPAAYALANDPGATAPYTPQPIVAYDSADEALTIHHEDEGEFRIEMPGQNLAKGNVQVVSGGLGPENYCGVDRWNPDDDVVVKCYTADGDPVDAVFLVSFQG